MHKQASEGHNNASNGSDSMPANSPPHLSSGKESSPPQHAQHAQYTQHAEQQAQYTQQAQNVQQAQHAQHAQQAGVPSAAPGSGIVITPEMISAVMAHLNSTGGANAASAQLPQDAQQRHWQNGDGMAMDAASRSAAGIANGGMGTRQSPPEVQQV